MTGESSLDSGEDAIGGDGIRKVVDSGDDKEGEFGRDMGNFRALLKGVDIVVLITQPLPCAKTHDLARALCPNNHKYVNQIG